MNSSEVKNLFYDKWSKEISDLDNSIQKLSQYLSILRKVAGWSTEELSSKLGVTKQTINNIEYFDVDPSNMENKVDPPSTYKMSYQMYYMLRCIFEREILQEYNPILAHIYRYFIIQNYSMKWSERYLLSNSFELIRKVVNSELIEALTEYYNSVTFGKRLLTEEMPTNNALIHSCNPEIKRIRKQNIERLIDLVDKKCKGIYPYIGIETKDNFKNINYNIERALYINWKNYFFDAVEKKESKLFENMNVSEEYIIPAKTLKKIEKRSN